VSAGPVGRVAILTVAEQAPLDTAVQFVALSAEVAVRRSDQSDLSPPSAGPPLFVRHCAFLI
jgi:hypothetical protein